MRLLLLALLLTACDGESSADAPSDASAEPPADAGADALLDASLDASVDSETSPDAQMADAAPDAVADAAPDRARPSPQNPLLSEGFLKIAHRGGKRAAPEETMPAFRHALEVGADVLEFDLHATSDGVIVCMHDADVDRTTDGEGAIAQMTFAELRALDAGYRFQQGGEFPFRGTGVVVPTFEEVLEAFPGVPMAIEIKQFRPSIVPEVVELIHQYEAVDRVSIAAFIDPIVQEVRVLEPRIATAFGAAEILAFMRVADETEADYVPPGHLLQVPRQQGGTEVVTAETLARAHRLGLKMQVWTINSRTAMEALIELGVDGIMTDDPELLSEVYQGR